MYDWTDDLYEQARITFPRLREEIDSLCTTEVAADMVLDLLMGQHPRCFQC